MKDSSFGIPIIRETSFASVDHQPGTLEVTKPHPLASNSYGDGYTPTKLSYVTVRGYDLEGQQVGYHHVVQLPTRLGDIATQLIASVWAKRFASKI
jgi:hypothetical protein